MYMTEQRKKLFAFFQSHPDTVVSAKEIAENFKDAEISLSAVYRNLSRLEQDGLIIRVPGKTSRENLYRYVHYETCDDRIHMTCVSCGRTLHMNEAVAERMMKSVLRKDKFAVDMTKTTIFGVCSDCR